MTVLDTSQANRSHIGALRAVGVIAARDLHRQIRRPGLLISNAAQVLFFVVTYAVGFDTMIDTVDGVPFSAFVLPGIIGIQVATISVTTGLSYAWDREYGVLREIVVAPVPRMCLPLGKVLGTTVLVSAQCVVLLACAPVFGLRPTLPTMIMAMGIFLLGAVVFSLLGLLLATVLKQVQTLQATVQLMMFPMLFLSGSVFQTTGVPDWLAALIRLNPLTYLVDAGRQVLTGGPAAVLPIGADLLVLLLLGMGLTGFIRFKIEK